MGRSKIIFYFLGAVLLLAIGLGLKVFLSGNNTSQAALRIDSFPRSTVSINDKVVGQTPYNNEKITAGTYSLKLDPTLQSGESLHPWRTTIKLTAGTLAYLSRDIAPSDDQSAGQILTLEPLVSGKSAELAVISDPDKAKVFIDGLDQGVAPLVLKNILAGDHIVIVSQDGHSDQIVHGKIINGYRLNVIVKLGMLSGSQATGSAQLRPSSDLIASISGSEISKPYVIIKNTPTGFLRIRTDPTSTATEVGQVKPNEKYPLLSETADWVKIKLPDIFGWVSDQYVDKIK